MKRIPCLIFVLFTLLVVGQSSWAADAELYWYEIGILPEKTLPFVGSSTSEPSLLASKLSQNEPIVLENIRSLSMGGEKDAKLAMRPATDTVRVVIPVNSVAYIRQLPKDPAVPQ